MGPMTRLLLVFLLLPALVLAEEPFDPAELRAAAEQGDPYAQLNLGAAYDHGLGLPEDPAEAEHWYRRAAQQQVPEAQFNLGHLLVSSGKDPAEGARWLRAAAEQGLADAQYLLGIMYAEGLGVAVDPMEAERWLKQAADQGQEEAAAYLAASFADSEPSAAP